MTEPSREIVELIAQGRKIEAIELLREQTGMGLAEAKAVVDRFESGAVAGPVAGPDAGHDAGELPPEVRALVDQGKVIAAIKLLRERTGLGLKDAKDRIDRATGRVHRVGCGAAALLGVAALAGLWACC